MRNPMNRIERFCYEHPNFGIKNLMMYISIANVAFWVLGAINRPFLSYLSFDAAAILHGQLWRLVTFMLYPPSTGLLAFIALFSGRCATWAAAKAAAPDDIPTSKPSV